MVSGKEKFENGLILLDKLSAEEIKLLNLTETAKHFYETAISQKINAELPEYTSSYYEADYTRSRASREWTNVGILAMRYEKALELAKKAEEKGIPLSEEYSTRTLSAKCKELEKNTEESQESFKEADHRLCIENYNAWKIANK